MWPTCCPCAGASGRKGSETWGVTRMRQWAGWCSPASARHLVASRDSIRGEPRDTGAVERAGQAAQRWHSSAAGDRLLQTNRCLVQGAFALDEAGTRVLYRKTLQLEHLDRHEVEGTIAALSLALAEFARELLAFHTP